MTLVKQEMFSCPEFTPGFKMVGVVQSLVFCVVLGRPLLVILSCLFHHCIVGPSSNEKGRNSPFDNVKLFVLTLTLVNYH